MPSRVELAGAHGGAGGEHECVVAVQQTAADELADRVVDGVARPELVGVLGQRAHQLCEAGNCPAPLSDRP
jgi:hypothetical protein